MTAEKDNTPDPRFVAGATPSTNGRPIVDPDESQANPEFAHLDGASNSAVGDETPTNVFASGPHRAAPERVEPGRPQETAGESPTVAFPKTSSTSGASPVDAGATGNGAYTDYQHNAYAENAGAGYAAAQTSPQYGADQEWGAEPAEDSTASDEKKEPTGPRGTIDLGLLFLRLGLGLTMAAHGLDKLFGIFGVASLDGTRSMLESLGFRDALLTPLAYGLGATELVAGALVVLGFMTPVAAAALLGTALTATLSHMQMNDGQYVFFMMDKAGAGLEFLHLITFSSAALILTGPGRIAVDLPFGWATRPRWGSFLWLLIGIGSAPLVWWACNTNPIPWPWN